MNPDGLRAAVSVSVAIFQACHVPGTKCAGKYNLLKYFVDVQACVLHSKQDLWPSQIRNGYRFRIIVHELTLETH